MYISTLRNCAKLIFPTSVDYNWKDRTKTRNRLGNGSKNGLIKLKICSPSGRGKSFHSRGLTSALAEAAEQKYDRGELV